jgi:hypothetical protein
MRTYKIVKKKIFESDKKFEIRINELSALGWRAISIALHGVQHIILMEKDR